MHVICGWCKEYMHEKAGLAKMVSHGMCKKCEDKFMAEAARYHANEVKSEPQKLATVKS